MPKKIVLLPGVGIHKDKVIYHEFLSQVILGLYRRGIECTGEICIWENGHDDEIIPLMPYEKIRRLFCSVLLDFMVSVKDGNSMPIPEADFYIGHSAGSIIALTRGKPCVIFGSPASLVNLIYDETIKAKWCSFMLRKGGSEVLNIINEYDPIAYPLHDLFCENYTFKPSWWRFLSKEPFTSHVSYWTSKEVIDVTVSRLAKWAKLA